MRQITRAGQNTAAAESGLWGRLSQLGHLQTWLPSFQRSLPSTDSFRIMCRTTFVAGFFASVGCCSGQGGVVFQDNFDSENGGVGALNYSAFANWTLVRAAVDLCGNGYHDVYPGNGLYIDMSGTPGQGKLQSKDLLSLSPGAYRLSFKLGNNLEWPELNRIDVSLGSAFAETFTRDGITALDLFVRTITASSAISAYLVFDSQPPLDDFGVILDDVKLERLSGRPPQLAQVTYRAGGGPCTSCCGIDHRQPLMSPDGSRFVFSSIWNVDDYVGNLNPERNRELFSYNITSNKFQQLTITTNGMSLPYSFPSSKLSFISCSPDFGGDIGTNMQVFGYDLATQTVTQWVNAAGPAPVQLGTNCPYAWFVAEDWTRLANVHADLSARQQHLVWASTRNLPSVGYPGGNNADGNYEIYWKDLAAGQVRQLTSTTGGDNVSSAAGANLWPRTSADGAKIVLASNRPLGGPTINSNRYGLFLASSTGVIQRLTAAEIEVAREFPAFGMDSSGTRVVFASDADLVGLNTNRNQEIYAVDLNTSSVTQITQTENGVTNSRPILSGDGLKVAFLSNGNLNGNASNNVEQLWVCHFDTDLAYPASFIEVTSLASSQSASDGRISWADWYSLDYTGSNLVFTGNADLVGSNTLHAYEVFLATFSWQPFKCAITRQETNQYRLDWPVSGGGLYTVESCTSLVNHAWAPVGPTNQWPTSATGWTNTLNPAEPARFFRVRAN